LEEITLNRKRLYASWGNMMLELADRYGMQNRYEAKRWFHEYIKELFRIQTLTTLSETQLEEAIHDVKEHFLFEKGWIIKEHDDPDGYEEMEMGEFLKHKL
jgi:hypothetical protein